jgi:1-acyl-sn-glycerol-3-phosphate acyltransferase
MLCVAMMALDGFRARHKQAFEAFSPGTAQRFYGRVDALGQRWHVRVDGLAHLPAGRAILVANHSFGFDVLFPMARIFHEQGRQVWALGEHLWWKVPYLRKFVASIGVVDGTQENLDALLSRDELVLVLPGGMREAVKPRELRYQLLWGHRYGFVRAAIRNRAPLVPVAGVGGDELFDFVGNPFRRGARWLGRGDLPIPLPSRILPIPRRTPLSFTIGEPISPPSEEELARDPHLTQRLRHEVEGALHELIEDELARRLGMAEQP